MKKINISIIIKFIIALVGVLASYYAMNVLNELDMIPSKYYLLLTVIILIINIVAIVTLIKKGKGIKIVTTICYVILAAFSVLSIKYGSSTIDFLKSAFNNYTKEVTVYDVVVLKESNINKLIELDNKKISYLSIEENNEKIMKDLNSNVKIKYEAFEDLFDLYNRLITYKTDAIVLNEAYLDLLSDDYENFDDTIKVIYTIEVEKEIKNEVEEIKTLKPINIFISGSDSRSTKIYNKSRSDVNMILTFNPYTHTVLTTSIPRDYFVQVHGQTGLKDKLTHSGIYGLDVSTATVEDLFNIDITYSIKIGFRSVVEVVDLLGGVDIDSDKEFNSYHKKGWRVQKGINHMDGEEALAYSRERYAYATGDRHRVQNQQQVLEAILKGILQDKNLLNKYDDYLKTLSNTYITNIPDSFIRKIVKDQLDSPAEWTFMTQTVSGSDLITSTHTAPNSKRYVMVPYEKDVDRAKRTISEVLNRK